MGLRIRQVGRAIVSAGVVVALVLGYGARAHTGPANAAPAAAAFKVPVEYYKLPNGLRVVLSPDHTAPTICVGAVSYTHLDVYKRQRWP